MTTRSLEKNYLVTVNHKMIVDVLLVQCCFGSMLVFLSHTVVHDNNNNNNNNNINIMSDS